MSRIRVILVEDDDFTRSMVAGALQIQGIDIVGETGSVGPAMKMAEELKPDAAILDLDLGAGPNGIDLAVALRRRQPRIGIVMLTTFEEPRLLNSKVSNPPAGAVYFVKKEIGEIELLYRGIQKAISNASNSSSSEVTPIKSKSLEGVTDSQLDTMRLVSQGLSNSQIAKLRGISEKSVEQTLSRLVANLGLQSAPDKNLRVQVSLLYSKLTGSTSGGEPSDTK
jgi:DNA-binding NarL/FixJ family response regulator